MARGEQYTLTYQSNGSIGLGLDKVYACEEEIGGKYDGMYLGVEVQKIVAGKQADEMNNNPKQKQKIMVGDLLVDIAGIDVRSRPLKEALSIIQTEKPKGPLKMTFERCSDLVFFRTYEKGSIGLKLDDGPNFMHRGIQVHGKLYIERIQ